jgi:hypothetical protein
MARPQNPEGDNRTVVIRLRVTPDEKLRVWQNAKDAGRTPSDFIRGLVLGTKPERIVPTADREALLKVLAEAGKQGSNLNQIARAINRRHDSYELIGIDWQQLNASMKAVEELKTQLMEMLTL